MQAKKGGVGGVPKLWVEVKGASLDLERLNAIFEFITPFHYLSCQMENITYSI